MIAAREHAVGISAYCSEHSGFLGLIKHRWEDFHVHEVDESGAVVHLTELQSRTDIISDLRAKKALDSGDGFFTGDFTFDHSTLQSLKSEGFLTSDDIDRIKTFVNCLAKVADIPNPDEIVGKDKEGQKSSSQIIPSQLMATSPPFCIIFGDLERCLETLIDAGNSDVNLSVAWKTLRKAVHCAIRQYLPFFSSETLSLNELSSSMNCLNEEITEIRIPTEMPIAPVNRKAIDLLDELKAKILETLEKERFKLKITSCDLSLRSDQLLRFIRLIPKPPCLKRLFTCFPKPAQTIKQSMASLSCPSVVESNTVNDCVVENPANSSGKLPSSSNCCHCSIEKRKRKKRGRKNESQKEQQSSHCSASCDCNARSKNNMVASHGDRWPKDRPPYLRFHMWKMNRDTAEVISMIAGAIGCNPKNLTFAGTKDRRAVTVQTVTAYKVSEIQIKRALLHPKWDKNVRVSSFSYVNERMQLGSLQGNHFRICVRGLNLRKSAAEPLDSIEEQRIALSACVSTALDELLNSGFINYFGLQRFGTRAISTHVIGIAIIRQEFETATRLILGDIKTLDLIPGDAAFKAKRCIVTEKCDEVGSSRIFEIPETELAEEQMNKKKRKIDTICVDAETMEDAAAAAAAAAVTVDNSKSQTWRSKYLVEGDACGALECLPRHMYLERQVLQSLAKNPKDFVGALQKLPKNTLTLYIHAVQSLVWNYVASYRIQKFGLTPVVDDFVLCSDNEAMKSSQDSSNDGNFSEDWMVDERNEKINRASRLKVIDTSSAATQYSLADVVLPIPGDKVRYPKHLINIYENAFKTLFEIELSDIGSLRKQGLGDYDGGYRHLIGVVRSLEYKIIHDIPNGDMKLLDTDVDHLLKGMLPEKIEQKSEQITTDSLSNTSALLLSCTLPKSCYITMALRELFKGEEICGF